MDTKPKKTRKKKAELVTEAVVLEAFATQVMQQPALSAAQVVARMGVEDSQAARIIAHRWIDDPLVQRRWQESILQSRIDLEHAVGVLVRQLLVSQADFRPNGRFDLEYARATGALDGVEELKYNVLGDVVGVRLPSKALIVRTLAQIKGWVKLPSPAPGIDGRLQELAIKGLNDLQVNMGLDRKAAIDWLKLKFPELYNRLPDEDKVV